MNNPSRPLLNALLVLSAGLLALGAPGAALAQGCPVKPADFTRVKVVGNELNEPMELDIDQEENVY